MLGMSEFKKSWNSRSCDLVPVQIPKMSSRKRA